MSRLPDLRQQLATATAQWGESWGTPLELPGSVVEGEWVVVGQASLGAPQPFHLVVCRMSEHVADPLEQLGELRHRVVTDFTIAYFGKF